MPACACSSGCGRQSIEIAGALEDLNQERQRPLGRLRIYATYMAAAAVVAPIWARFLSTYPEVHLELQVGEAPIDIVAKGFDAGIGPQRPGAGRHDCRSGHGADENRRGWRAVLFCASAARRARPMISPVTAAFNIGRAADGAVFAWPFERNGKSRRISVDGRVMVNDADLAVRAAVDGLGIAYTIEAWPSHSCARASWSACWKTGRRRSKGCSSITRATGRSRPHCAPSST